MYVWIKAKYRHCHYQLNRLKNWVICPWPPSCRALTHWGGRPQWAAQSRINGCLLLPQGGFPVWGNNSNLITWIRSRRVIDQKRPYQVNKAIDLDKDTSPQRHLVVVALWFKLLLPFFSCRTGRLWRSFLAGWILVNVGVRQWFSCSGINELWNESHNGADGHPVSKLLDNLSI